MCRYGGQLIGIDRRGSSSIRRRFVATCSCRRRYGVGCAGRGCPELGRATFHGAPQLDGTVAKASDVASLAANGLRMTMNGARLSTNNAAHRLDLARVPVDGRPRVRRAPLLRCQASPGSGRRREAAVAGAPEAASSCPGASEPLRCPANRHARGQATSWCRLGGWFACQQ